MSTTEMQSIPVPEPGLTQDEVVQRARDMIPVLRERQEEECEPIGRLPDETSRDFVEAGFLMRTNGSAGMRGGAMWQRLQRDLTVLMTHNTVQPELAADSFGRLHFGLLPHGVEEGSGAGPVPPTVR